MRQILCYGDSNTYGLVPKEHARYPWGIRWTSRLNEKLGLKKYRVIEEGLCGRTTVFDDPFRDHRNGAKFVNAVLETHGASDLIILMLGTNDCKTVYETTPELIGKGVETVIAKIRSFAPDSGLFQHRQQLFDVVVRARDHMRGDYFAQPGRCCAAGFDRRFHGADVAAHHDAHQSGADFLRTDQRDVGGFGHGIGRFNCRDQAAGFDHSKCFHHNGFHPFILPVLH